MTILSPHDSETISKRSAVKKHVRRQMISLIEAISLFFQFHFVQIFYECHSVIAPNNLAARQWSRQPIFLSTRIAANNLPGEQWMIAANNLTSRKWSRPTTLYIYVYMSTFFFAKFCRTASSPIWSCFLIWIYEFSFSINYFNVFQHHYLKW